MSLIQEALKRQQQEAGQSAPAEAKPPVQVAGANTPISLRKNAAQAAPAEAPPPLPAEALQPAEKSTIAFPIEGPSDSKKKMSLLIAGVVLLLCLAGGVWAYFHFRESKPQPTAKPVEKVQSKPAPAQAPVVPETPKPEVAPAQPAPAPEPQAVTGAVPTAVKPVQPAPLPEPAPPAPSMPPAEDIVTWPTLTISGFVGQGSNGSVIINKQIIDVGGSIEGVKVVAIRNKSVELEFKGRKQTLRRGDSTQ